MELYTKTAYQQAELLTNKYSTSFSSSSRLFASDIRPHIYAIYGFVRIADEIVDTYQGEDSLELLDNLEKHAYEQMEKKVPFSTNPIVHAFVHTAKLYNITEDLIRPFFVSMHMDIDASNYSDKEYEKYIYGSAEVIGLMCLKVFCEGDEDLYKELASGARKLGSAYQKVNFLRDMKSDFDERGRVYFPGVSYKNFSDSDKAKIEEDIKQEFKAAKKVIPNIPTSARQAVKTSYAYYYTLLEEIEKLPATEIITKRIRVPNSKKLKIFVLKGLLDLWKKT